MNYISLNSNMNAILLMLAVAYQCTITLSTKNDTSNVLCYYRNSTHLIFNYIADPFYSCGTFNGSTYCAITTNSTTNIDIGYCASRKLNMASCNYNYECLSLNCSNYRCYTPQPIKGACTYNTDCLPNSYCSLSVCTQAKAYYSECTYDVECITTSRCFGGLCVPYMSFNDNVFVGIGNYNMCTSAYESNGFCANRPSTLPILVGNPSFKICTSDSDCLYQYADGSIKSISGSCICVPQSNIMMCVYGGSEPQILSAVKSLYQAIYSIPLNKTVITAGIMNADKTDRLSLMSPIPFTYYYYLAQMTPVIPNPIACKVTECVTYSTNNKLCFVRNSTANSYKISIPGNQYGACPYPDNTFTCQLPDIYKQAINLNVTCRAPYPVGSGCLWNGNCASQICSSYTCISAYGYSGANCKYTTDCSSAHYCLLLKCVPRIGVGSTCSVYNSCLGRARCINSTCIGPLSVSEGLSVLSADDAVLCKSYFVNSYNICVLRSTVGSLVLFPGTNYIRCSTDKDCAYYSSNGFYSIAGSCRCPADDVNGYSYCIYLGGEQLFTTMLSTLPSLSTESDYNFLSYFFDTVNSISLINPASCSYSAFVSNQIKFGQSTSVQCLKSICSTDSDNLCYLKISYNEHYFYTTSDNVMTCSSGKYCNISTSSADLLSGNCTSRLATGVTCTQDMQCANFLCRGNPPTCKSKLLTAGTACTANNECSSGLYCNSTNYCATSVAVGSRCNLDSDCKLGSGCYNYICTNYFSIADGSATIDKIYCSSYSVNPSMICTSRSTLPSLNYDTGVTYKACTKNTDCIYTYPTTRLNGYLYTDACVCGASDAKGVAYCKYGGGEAVMITAATIVLH